MDHNSEQKTFRSMDDDMISLSEIFDILWRGKWWVAACTTLALVVALVYLAIAKPVYKSSALIKVDHQ